MLVLVLARYYLKRIIRHGTITAIALTLPLLMGLTKRFLPQVEFTSTLAFWCPVICAAYVFSVVYLQKSTDKSSGLMDGLRSSPLNYATIVGAQATAGLVIFAVQMGIFGGLAS